MNEPQTIHSLLHHLSAVFARESDQILQEQLGIGLAQFKILTTLINNPVAQQRYIAVSLGQTEASISRQVKLLLKKGMLESRVNPHNRREHRTTLTPKGQRIMSAAQQVLKGYQSGSLVHMSTKQRDQLLELLISIHP